MVAVMEAPIRELAPREMNLEALLEWQAFELIEQLIAAPAAQPLVREQVTRVERHAGPGVLRERSEEVVGVDAPDDESRTVREARKLEQQRDAEGPLHLPRVRDGCTQT